MDFGKRVIAFFTDKFVGQTPQANKAAPSSSTRKRRSSRLSIDSASSSWKIVRLAAKDKEQREKEGGSFRSPQRKISCETLRVTKEGVIGSYTRKPSGFLFMSPSKPVTAEVRDFNSYRSEGDPRRGFKPGSKDRAVSIATTGAYEMLRHGLTVGQDSNKEGTSSLVQDGDFGENILIDCPLAVESKEAGLYVGAKLKIGKVVLQITEANNPCYRFNAQSWAPRAEKIWGDTAPDGEAKKWFKSPMCPLNHEVNPGVRGWLAKVVKEGEIGNGDEVAILPETTRSTKQSSDSMTSASKGPRPSKRQKSASSPPRSSQKSPKRRSARV